MKSILTYYGGKQKIAYWIESHFPSEYQDLHYVEPFFGGGAVFFQKRKGRFKETINDLDGNLYHFYRTIQDHPEKILKKMNDFLFFEDEYRRANNVISNPKEAKDEIDRAYCYWVSIMTAFNCGHKGGFKFRKISRANQASVIQNNIKKYPLLFERIKAVTIFNRDAIELINLLDHEDCLMYLDPPYPEAEQQYKCKFTKEEFEKLINSLKNFRGRFLLSCYEKDWMNFPTSWNKHYYNTKAHIARKADKQRTECLITNYQPEINLKLF